MRRFGFFIIFMLIVMMSFSACGKKERKDIFVELENDAVITEVETVDEVVPQTEEPIPPQKLPEGVVQSQGTVPVTAEEDVTTSQETEPVSDEDLQVPVNGIQVMAQKVDPNAASPLQQSSASTAVTQNAKKYPAPNVPPPPYKEPGAVESAGDFLWHLFHPLSRKDAYGKKIPNKRG